MTQHPQGKRAPEFASNLWLNTDTPIQMASLRGQAVLLDIWDYTSIHCLRTLPYVREWHRRYAEHGLVVIGIHAPEFTFGREKRQVELALQEQDIHYPVLMDNDFKTWRAYENQFWPAKYLIDQEGYIRGVYYGEGPYEEIERTIQTLLREINPLVDLPSIMHPLRPEDYPETLPTTTRLLRGGLVYGALGNPEGYAGGIPMVYSLPSNRPDGAFYVAGAWKADSQYLMYQGRSEGVIAIPYEAAEVNAVLSPHADTVERMLHPDPVSVEIWQDDLPLHAAQRGADVTDEGRLLVDRPRMYNLIRNPRPTRHELTLRVTRPGFALYAFALVGI